MILVAFDGLLYVLKTYITDLASMIHTRSSFFDQRHSRQEARREWDALVAGESYRYRTPDQAAEEDRPICYDRAF